MNVALDGTPLSVSTGGITRYAEELSRALAREFPEDEYWLVSDQPFPLNSGRPPNLRRGRRANSFLQRRWWSCGAIAEMLRLRIDVFHGTDFAVPYLPVRPSVLTLHDLSPWRRQSWHWTAGRVRRRTPYLLDLGLATMVLTPSESIRREAIERFRIHPSRIVSVPLAASSHFQPVAEAPAAEPYFLYLGVLEPRKNISLLLEAWREVRREHRADLILAGRRREDFPELPPEPGLRILGEVLYSGAVAFLYPSLYEGFGLPVLEAMRCGAAVICSTDPALAEVAGDAAVRLDARDASEWAAAMTAALTRPDWLAGKRRKALQRAQQFSWPRTARLTREVYEEARRRFGS
jgi:glycosyltransferase involved in cell wall biosynthesis